MTLPRHLTYDCPEAWAEGEGLPKHWTKHPNKDLWFQQLAELKQHLWSQHIATLSEAEQQEIKAGTHPSQSHKFGDRAQPFTNLLHEELAWLGYDAKVTLLFYHLDRIVLCAALDRTPPGRLHGVPWLYRGFEVKYGFPDNTRSMT